MERTWALWEFTQHELVYLGFIVGFFRGRYGSAGKDWCERDQFQSGDCDSHGCDSCLRLGGCDVYQPAAAFSNQQENLDLSDSFRAGDWTVLAVLLPSPAARRGLACRSGRQAQRGRGHCAGCDFSARTTHLAPLGRGTIHFLRRGGAGVCIVRDATFVDLPNTSQRKSILRWRSAPTATLPP